MRGGGPPPARVTVSRAMVPWGLLGRLFRPDAVDDRLGRRVGHTGAATAGRVVLLGSATPPAAWFAPGLSAVLGE